MPTFWTLRSRVLHFKKKFYYRNQLCSFRCAKNAKDMTSCKELSKNPRHSNNRKKCKSVRGSALKIIVPDFTYSNIICSSVSLFLSFTILMKIWPVSWQIHLRTKSSHFLALPFLYFRFTNFALNAHHAHLSAKNSNSQRPSDSKVLNV